MFQKPKTPFHCDIRTSFAKAFSTWRRKNNVPLKEIAAELGISVATVNSWELGERFPTGDHFQALVNYMGVPPCRLFCIMADKCKPAECQLALLKSEVMQTNAILQTDNWNKKTMVGNSN